MTFLEAGIGESSKARKMVNNWIWNQTQFNLVPNPGEDGKYNLIPFDSKRIGKYIDECTIMHTLCDI